MIFFYLCNENNIAVYIKYPAHIVAFINIKSKEVYCIMFQIKAPSTLDNRIKTRNSSILKYIWYNKWLYAFMLPAVLAVFIFSYIPMWGIIIAFQDFEPLKGIFHSDFVGLHNFKVIFDNPDFARNLRNTLGISLLGFTFGFPLPIILAIFLNELTSTKFKRFFQTASYLPHFISWVTVAGIMYTLMDYNTGIINKIISTLGIERVEFFAEPSLFWPLSVGIAIWKELGWAAIIYIATIASIDPELYEAAIVDGAGRYKRMIHITLPGIAPIISLSLVLTAGSIFSGAGICPGFDGVFNLYNAVVSEYAETIDYWVYREGLMRTNFSFGTSVGLLFSVINLTLLLCANKIANKINDSGLF